MIFFINLAATAFAFQSPLALRVFRQAPARNGVVKLLSTKTTALEYLKDSNYQTLLRGDGDNRAVLVDACAPWCGPCKLIEPALKRCGERWARHLKVVKFDVESGQTDVKLELLMQGVMPRALPSLILFHDGKAIAKHKGVITEEQLDAFVESNLPPEVLCKERAGAGRVSFASRNGGDDYMLSSGA